MLGCICGGWEVLALLGALGGFSGITAWITSKYNKVMHHKTCSKCIEHNCDNQGE